MVLAILCFVIVHPGPVVVIKMPSVFDGLRAKIGIRRGVKSKTPQLMGMDPEGGYMELRDDAMKGFGSRT
jgi:hypothetical protein